MSGVPAIDKFVQGGGPSVDSTIRTLRETIRSLEGGRIHGDRRACGVAVFDELLGGLPVPGLIELHGHAGSGRTRLGLRLAARLIERGTLVAIVDPQCVLYPPAVAHLGVDLGGLLLVHPPPRSRLTLATERAPLDWEGWAVEQLLRSGCFPLVIAVEPRIRGRAGHRWVRAAEAGGCTGLVISAAVSRSLPAHVRLAVDAGRVVVVRDRTGHSSPGRRHAGLASPVRWSLVR